MGGKVLVDYDPVLRRGWIGGQRLHHGTTGAAFAVAGLAGLVAHRLSARNALPATLLGTALMAHDWHDRSHWFERGHQTADLPPTTACDRRASARAGKAESATAQWTR